MPQSNSGSVYPLPATPSTTKLGEPRFLDQVANACRLRHFAYSTEQSYVAWAKRFILFHSKRHPKDIGTANCHSRRRQMTD